MPFAYSSYSPGALGALRPGLDAQDHAPGRALRGHLMPRIGQPERHFEYAVTANAAAVIEASAAAFAVLPLAAAKPSRQAAQARGAQSRAQAPIQAEAESRDAAAAGGVSAEEPSDASGYAPHEPLPAWRRIQMLY
jgi:hypothetical protein